METAQSRQKSYADKRRRPLEFQVGDSVFLKVAPFKGVIRFGKRGKLNPRYIGPYEVLERIGKAAYRLALPPNMASVHNVFHVSMLKKYVPDESHVLEQEPIELHEDLSYEEKPVQILDRKIKTLRNKEIPLIKVLWRNQKTEEATWEREEEMRTFHPELRTKSFNSVQTERNLNSDFGIMWVWPSVEMDFSSCLKLRQRACMAYTSTPLIFSKRWI
ncbi:hypothetical protein UlMin_029751 [Ulmus minor]